LNAVDLCFRFEPTVKANVLRHIRDRAIRTFPPGALSCSRVDCAR
jgi:hypothetical protein